ncbi:MAG: S8 family serine peptidase [Weeksellaceae bacterium]
MKKTFVSLLVLLFGFYALAQNTQVSQEELQKRNWFHSDFSQTGIYGVGTDSALEFLKSKGMKPTKIVVGVLDSGVQITHEDLKNEIWVNTKEVAGNGKDDDKNGYVDDINGWDFCTTADGEDYNHDSYEATRVTVIYNAYFNTGNKAKDLENMRKMPKEYQTYLRARQDWADHYYSAKSQASGDSNETEQIIDFLKDLAAYTKGVKLTPENLTNLPENTEEEKIMKSQVEYLVTNNPEFGGMTMLEIIEEAKKEFGQVEESGNRDLLYAYNLEYNPAKGKFDVKGYGNNEVEGPDALHGTHVAGIIGASRGNNIGMDGVAGGMVKIMSVRTVPDGDERDEDVANAIRYAVDNGAKILNMSFGKSFSPNKEMVYDAIKYADSKGVLMFHAAGNDNKDLDFNYNYPSNFRDNEMVPMVDLMITVGASTRYNDRLKASFSNFGAVKVDLFAPGTEIYAPVPDQKYRYLQGTSMASPVAAGCAALLWSYFPHLTAKQVKDLLFETVNVADTEVNVGSEAEPRKFNTISVTGGVIDVNKAVRLAYERYGKK